jgi:hypothetical protein
MTPTAAQIELLQALATGQTLKSHRDVEGHKEYRRHTLDGQSTRVAWADVEALQTAGLIDSNKKFPAATYWLTERGRSLLGLS